MVFVQTLIKIQHSFGGVLEKLSVDTFQKVSIPVTGEKYANFEQDIIFCSLLQK
jgi:hypothetical protein